MSEITIRSATPEDAGDITVLATELGYPNGAATVRLRIEALLPSAADLLLVAIDANDEMAGWLQAHAAQIIESGFRVEITGLVVSSKIRRGGVGRALMAAAERWAISIQAESLVVRSNVKRVESHVFYDELGFSVGKTQHVYHKPLRPNPAATPPE